jgi:predicted DNA binding CopG/RHH family protein
MKYYELSKEEENILKNYEDGILVKEKDQNKQLTYYQKIAKNTLGKTKNINIRLPEKILAKLKAKAAMEGIPYQTLASSLLHKYASM